MEIIKMKDIILFHGSRGGIDGPIKPSSRIRCDFGQGFYMGQDAMQAKSLVTEDSTPYFYTLKFKLSEIPEDRILNLTDDKDWLYTILANRKRVQEFNELNIAKEYLTLCSEYDVIIGQIADDKMADAMQRFANYGLTDKGLIACLKSIKYGNQYVAKTAYACSKIEILDEKILYGKELADLCDYSITKRNQSKTIVNEIAKKYQRQGLFLNEIIENEKEKELSNELEVDEYDNR